MRHDDPRSLWDPKVYPKNNLHWHQLGNDRITANAYNLGFVKLFYGETGAYWLNEYEPEKNEHSGGFGWLIDGDTVLIDRDEYVPDGADWERIFGMGHFVKTFSVPGLDLNRWVWARSDTDRPYLISHVFIQNTSDRDKELTLIEYWDVNIRLIDDFLLLGGLADKGRDYRMDVVFDGSVLQAVPRSRPPSGKAPRKPTLVYPYLPTVFLASPIQNPDAWIIDPNELFENGEPIKDPEKLRNAGTKNSAAKALSQDQVCLAAKFTLRIPAGKDVFLVFAYGYQSPLETEKIDFALELPPELSVPDIAKVLERWDHEVTSLYLPGLEFLDRELAWDYYYLTSSTIWDAYYEKHHIPQGANYLYYSGGNGATRDYAAFVMTLAYYRPALAREILEFMCRAQDPDGRMFYDLEGFGKRYTVPYRPGDLDLWFLWALSEYVFATRDFAFLDRVEPFYPMGSGESATVYEHARRSLDHLINQVGTGLHGHPRLRLSDWNDEMTFLTAGSNPIEIIATFMRGESVLNTAMACYIMPRVRDLARSHGDEETAQKAEAYLEKMKKALASAWREDHLIRSYSGLGRPFGEDVIFLEPQVWALLAGDVLSGEQTRTLIHTIDERLIKPSPLGMLISNSTSGSLTTRAGEQEEGGIWFAINGPASVALAKYDRDLGWDQVLRNTLAWHADVYPGLWYGIWSGPDAWNSVFSERPGETWYMKSAVMNTGPQMYPIQNAHSHSQTMWAVARLAGVTPTAEGWRIEPRIPAERYSFGCALFGIEVTPDSMSGYSRAGGPLTITLKTPPAWAGREIRLTSPGRRVETKIENGTLRFDLPASENNRQIRWEAILMDP